MAGTEGGEDGVVESKGEGVTMVVCCAPCAGGRIDEDGGGVTSAVLVADVMPCSCCRWLGALEGSLCGTTCENWVRHAGQTTIIILVTLPELRSSSRRPTWTPVRHAGHGTSSVWTTVMAGDASMPLPTVVAMGLDGNRWTSPR